MKQTTFFSIPQNIIGLINSNFDYFKTEKEKGEDFADGIHLLCDMTNEGKDLINRNQISDEQVKEYVKVSDLWTGNPRGLIAFLKKFKLIEKI